MEIYVWTGVTNCVGSLECYLSAELWRNEGNKCHHNTWWVHKQFITTVHRVTYFLHGMMSPCRTIKKTIFTHQLRVSSAMFKFMLIPSQSITKFFAGHNDCDAKKWCYGGVVMSAMSSQIIGVLIVYSTVCSGSDERKYQSSAWLAFAREIHWWPVNSPHKRPVTRNMFLHLMTSSWQ